MTDNTFEKLFEDFPPVTTDQWEAIIEKDLKGAPYDKKLIWRTLEGINFKPYYRAGDLENLSYVDTLPGEAPYLRGEKIQNNDWEIQQDVHVKDGASANKRALELLNKGVTSVNFVCCGTDGGCVITDKAEFKALLKDIYIECINLNFACGSKAPEVIDLLIEEVKERGIDKTQMHGNFSFDPLGKLNSTGNWYISEEEDFETLAKLTLKLSEELPNFKLIKVRGCELVNSGSNVIQDLAFSLAMANEYMTVLTDKSVPVETAAKTIYLSLGIAARYFLEIAKLRGARVLWSKVLEAYGIDSHLHIHCITSAFNQTLYDPHNNILRGTTEAMSAVIGGCNALTVRPFDAAYKESDNFSERIARNIQIILKEEAYFDKIVDPASGSYYIENLTESLMEHVWNEFLVVEEKGGYLAALKEGYIQDQIEATEQLRKQRIAQRKAILVGTNQFPNFGEAIADKIDTDIAFNDTKKETGVVRPLHISRASVEIEKIRLATENFAKQPKVFLLTHGNLTMRKARATFSSNFFGCAGYEIIDNLGFETADAGAKAALEAGANIVVLCSSDDEYAELAPAVYNLLKDKCIVVVAGAPACADDLKAKGIEHFINVRSNVLETLQKFNLLLGI